MKQTLLELTQAVMSSMDSDEVNSINDTVESQQVATLIKNVYFDIIYRADLPEHYSIINLEASGDNTKPTLMTVPQDVAKVLNVHYDTRNTDADPVNMSLLTFLPIEDFLTYVYQFDVDADNVDSFTLTNNANTFTFYYYNDTAPQFYTTFDDSTVIFDAYNASIETTLQKNKTSCIARLIIPFTMSDTFIPGLDAEQFPLLLNEAKSLAWVEIKQSQHPIAERNSRRAWVHLQKHKDSVDNLSDFDKLLSFGRK